MHVAPLSCERTVTGLSSETSAGHVVLNGGGGLHVALGWHSTLIAAEHEPSLFLKTVHATSLCVGVVCGGGGSCGRGGFTTTGPFGGVGGGACCSGGGVGRGGLMTTGPVCGVVGGDCCSGGIGRGGFDTTGPCVGPGAS